MAALADEIRRRVLQAVPVLEKLGIVRAVYVFGSHAEGRADCWSDIDLAVFMDGVETWDIHRRARAMVLVQKEAGWDMEAHFFSASSLTQPQPGSFAEFILRHGVDIVREPDASDPQ
jgi:predicted nucleotidyltransferase